MLIEIFRNEKLVQSYHNYNVSIVDMPAHIDKQFNAHNTFYADKVIKKYAISLRYNDPLNTRFDISI